MSPVITIDANVWVALLDQADAFHKKSLQFFQKLEKRGDSFFAPRYMLLEVGCAIARRCRDQKAGLSAVRAIGEISCLRLKMANEELMTLALQLGSKNFLRGADALYVAVAYAEKTPLVTWDDELRSRAKSIIKVQTPDAWLRLEDK